MTELDPDSILHKPKEAVGKGLSGETITAEQIFTIQMISEMTEVLQIPYALPPPAVLKAYHDADTRRKEGHVTARIMALSYLAQGTYPISIKLIQDNDKLNHGTLTKERADRLLSVRNESPENERALSDLESLSMVNRVVFPNLLPWFSIQEDLAYCFAGTDVRGMTGADVHFPYTSFGINVPDGLIRYGSWDASGLIVTRYKHIVRVVILFHQDESIFPIHDFFFLDPSRDLETARTETFRSLLIGDKAVYSINGKKNPHYAEDFDKHEAKLVFTMGSQNTPVSRKDGWAFVVRYLLNFCLYATAHPESLSYERAQRIAKLKKRKARIASDKQELLELESMRVMTTDRKIDPSVKEAVLEAGAGSTWSLRYKTMVRGHWRNQVCGEGRQKRKLIFIEPHIRGKGLEDAIVASHTYDVEPPTHEETTT